MLFHASHDELEHLPIASTSTHLMEITQNGSETSSQTRSTRTGNGVARMKPFILRGASKMVKQDSSSRKRLLAPIEAIPANSSNLRKDSNSTCSGSPNSSNPTSPKLPLPVQNRPYFVPHTREETKSTSNPRGVLSRQNSDENASKSPSAIENERRYKMKLNREKGFNKQKQARQPINVLEDDFQHTQTRSDTFTQAGKFVQLDEKTEVRREANFGDITNSSKSDSPSTPMRVARQKSSATQSSPYPHLSKSHSPERWRRAGNRTNFQPEVEERAEYKSMHDMLKSSGYTEIRVITPTAPIRILGPTTTHSPTKHPLAETDSLVSSPTFLQSGFGSPSSLAPPLSRQHKTSMLSLRGLFSLWAAEQSDIKPEVAEIPSPSPQVDSDSESAASQETIKTKTQREQSFRSETENWAKPVEGQLQARQTRLRINTQQSYLESKVLTPNLPKSPSLSTKSSFASLGPNSIQTPRKSSAPVELTPQSAQRQKGVSNTRSARQPGAVQTLRHVVSDPSLQSAKSLTKVSASGYQSFALNPFSDEDESEEAETRREYDDVQDSTTTTKISYWPNFTSLRNRASEAILGFGYTQTGAQPPAAPVDARPKVLKQAISSGQLRAVPAPVLSTELKFDLQALTAERELKKFQVRK